VIFSSCLLLGPARAESDGLLNIVEYTLDNGLEVILVEDHSAPTVAVDVWYRVGGANDPTGRSGFAHLFEHMMFQGSANVPRGAHFELVEQAGGEANATTSRDRTNYYQRLPAHQLPLGLWLEAERMRSLVVDEENFIREREVVKEEYRMRVDNRPYGEAGILLQTLPYDYPPYRQAVIGSVEDLDRATVDEVRAFHDTYYKPNNATLVVAGNLDVEQTRALIGQYFGDIPRQEPPPELPPYQPIDPTAPREARFVTLEDAQARVPAAFIGYTVPPIGEPDFYAVDLLAYILGIGDSSRLAETLVETGAASSADASVSGNRGPSLFLGVLVPSPGVEMAQLEEVFYRELERIRREGVSPDELAKAVNLIRTGRIQGLQGAFGLAESVHYANFYLGDPDAVLTELDRYSAVTSEDLQRVAQQYLAPQNRFVIHTVPASGGG
jgi:zinc protease